MIVRYLQRFNACPTVRSKTVKFTIQPEAGNESPEGGPDPGDDRHGRADTGIGTGEMVALKPDPVCRKVLPPILLNVTAPAAEIHFFAVQCQGTLQGMGKAEDAVIAFHTRHPGIPTHDTGRKPCHRPGVEWTKVNFTSKLTCRIINCQMQMVAIKAVFSNPDSEMPVISPEILKREFKIGACAVHTVQHLNKGVCIPAQDHPRDNGDFMA